ncbi:CatB-related O-acetyltransferase [Sphingosinicella rhizophila]|uniref:CatB-related O-acetyltransferase n=1 Tax=Sphingosinicella rhizophila TaxID=3050082 RepID=A0ABU3Q8L5_9SPHN|nr:CatB-related O-acetyltransferase [Sphingosinicella sp. GR2756]MDT9599642.1 CatB-related O-acetyltransferase [Sphingosinicella sp. GR2756]
MRRLFAAAARALRPAPIDPGVQAERHVSLANCTLLAPVRIGYRSYSIDSLFRNATVGRFCSIGRRCSIGAAMHLTDRVSTHPFILGEFEWGPPVEIGHDVWIGDNVVIMSGLTIGTGSVIGAGAVVTRDVAPYSIIAGVPGKLLRMRFDAATVERLLESHWWNYGDAVQGATGIDAALARLQNADQLDPHFEPYRPA